MGGVMFRSVDDLLYVASGARHSFATPTAHPAGTCGAQGDLL